MNLIADVPQSPSLTTLLQIILKDVQKQKMEKQKSLTTRLMKNGLKIIYNN